MTHNPSRFANFKEMPNGKGFTLPDGKEFFYDDFGGWFDEEKNYYNSEGRPASPPKTEDYYEDDYEKDYEVDELLKEYEHDYKDNDYNEDPYDDIFYNFKHQQKMEKMEKHVKSYPQGSDITIEFSNMNFKANRNDLADFFTHDYHFFSPDVRPIKNITVDMQESNPHLKKGTGRIVTNLKDFALFCLKKDGSELLGRPLNLEVESFLNESEDEEEVKVVKENINQVVVKEDIKEMKKPSEEAKQSKEESKTNDKKPEQNNANHLTTEPKTEEKKTENTKIEQVSNSADPWDKPIAKADPNAVAETKPKKQMKVSSTSFGDAKLKTENKTQITEVVSLVKNSQRTGHTQKK